MPTTSALTIATGPAATRGAGPAGAIGPAGLERVAQVGADAARREHGVEQQGAVVAAAGDVGGEPLVEEVGERVDPVARRR